MFFYEYNFNKHMKKEIFRNILIKKSMPKSPKMGFFRLNATRYFVAFTLENCLFQQCWGKQDMVSPNSF